MAITITKMAQLAGTSISTVSRALADARGVSETKRALIKRLAAEFGYQPNGPARTLVTKSGYRIGVLLPRAMEQLPYNLVDVLRGVTEATRQANYDLLLMAGYSPEEDIRTIIAKYKGQCMDGVIVLATRKKDDVIAYLHESGIPAVLVGKSEEYPGFYSSDCDHRQAAQDCTAYLIRQGHRRIAMLHGSLDWGVYSDQLMGYRAALREARIPLVPGWIKEGEAGRLDGRIAQWMAARAESPSAIVVHNDHIALRVLSILAGLRYRVPDTVSVMSFNKWNAGIHMTPSLTTVDTSVYQSGYNAAVMLIQLLSGSEPQSARIITRHRIVARESTSLPRPACLTSTS